MRIFKLRLIFALLSLGVFTKQSSAFSLELCVSVCCQLFNGNSYPATKLTLPTVSVQEIKKKFPDSNRPVVVITDAWDPQINGVVNTMKNMKAQFEKLGINAIFINPSNYPNFKPNVKAAQDISLAWVSNVDVDNILRWNPAAIHIATVEGTVGAQIGEALNKKGVSFTTGFHTQFPEYVHDWTGVPTSAGYALMRALHRTSEGVLVPTQEQGNLLMKMGFSPEKIRLWSRGIDTEAYKPHPKEENFWPEIAQKLTGEKRDIKGPIQGYVGRVTAEKNLETWFKTKTPGTKVVIGAGPDLEAYKAKYPDVVFLGPVTDLPLKSKLYSQMDVFVFSSLTDTFGNVQLEAAATGTPVAAFPNTGSSGVVEKNQIGVTHKDLATAIEEALKMDRTKVRDRVLPLGWQDTALQMLHYMKALPSNKKP